MWGQAPAAGPAKPGPLPEREPAERGRGTREQAPALGRGGAAADAGGAPGDKRGVDAEVDEEDDDEHGEAAAEGAPQEEPRADRGARPGPAWATGRQPAEEGGEDDSEEGDDGEDGDGEDGDDEEDDEEDDDEEERSHYVREPSYSISSKD